MSKVLILGTDVFSKGGIQRYTRYQFAALNSSEKFHVGLFSLYPPKHDNQFEENIEVTYVGAGKSLVSKLRYGWHALKYVRKHKVSLIISTHVQLSIIAYFAKRLFGTKYVTNVYGIEVWGNLKFRDRLGLSGSDQVIGDCQFVLRYIKKYLNFSGESALLYDPVDVDRFKPLSVSDEFASRYGIPREAFIVMTVGRLERNKGHRVMIKALAQLPENVFYIIVGGGFMNQELSDWARVNGVSHRVVFTGRVAEVDLVSIYNLANVVLLLSTFGSGEGEGLPLGLIEGSACGKPIICGNEDGSAEAYDQANPNGFLLSPTDVTAVAESIIEYLNSPKLLKVHGASGRYYVEKNFNLTAFNSKLCKIATRYVD